MTPGGSRALPTEGRGPAPAVGPAGTGRTPHGLRRVTAHWHLWLWLTAVWVGLWGDLSVANVLGGLAVSTAALLLLPLPETRGAARVRPVHTLRLLGRFLVDLVVANVVVAAQVLRVTSGLGRPLRQAVVACPMRTRSDRLVTTVANLVSLTPGTLTVEIDRREAVIYVHALDNDDPDALRAEVSALEARVIRALGSDEAVEALRTADGGSAGSGRGSS